ncbi:MAG TPA: 4Fe-4S dicluster domain-containing protein [Candidatus Parcubacteria bacterium]|nr:4Fe-4S dicluster domain-containing protein [Candidatus Parcubacteria bacterium]
MKKNLKKIAITGGKGGTGKSTFAVLFSSRLIKQGKKVILCDCDVECPNDYLLLGKKNLNKAVKKIFAEFPVLIKKKCKKCGLCVKSCRQNAIFQPRNKDGSLGYPQFIKNLCSGCGVCASVCPFGAIKYRKEANGRIYVNKVKENFWLITGLANANIEETGPIVRETKEFALSFAQKRKADYIIFDTAAGTHCPVISALLGCDSAYCVSEPTPMGAYDLKLILSLIKKLKIPGKIILNQADLGDKKLIESAASEFKVKVIEEIPYSRELVKAYSKGRLLQAKIK